jgi:hypothetical protein
MNFMLVAADGANQAKTLVATSKYNIGKKKNRGYFHWKT